MTSSLRRQPGFTLVELATTVAVIAVVCLAAMPGLGRARKVAGLSGSLANLRRIGEMAGNYAADFDDQSWSFTWSPGNCQSDYPDLRDASNPGLAFIYQAIDIARRLSGRDDLPRVDDRLRPVHLSTLVLADYVGDELPVEWMISPGDAVRIEWQQSPDDAPSFGDPGGNQWEQLFCPFGSSYGLMPAFWAPDERVGQALTVYQNPTNHGLIYWPNAVEVGKRRMAEVAFPSQKVRVAERESFFFGVRPVFYLHPTARVPLLMGDGSAEARATADANASFRPNSPDDTGLVSLLDYQPHPLYEAPAMTGAVDTDLDGRYKWTRRGLRGIDFGGERAE